jgi:tyrosine-specific transport protein
MFGGIIGAGIFGVPFVFARAGVLVGLGYVIFIGAAAALVNVYYAVIAVETSGRHRLAGYARKYLGNRAAFFVAGVSLIEFFGALLVYIILGGNFLAVVFGGAAGFWSMVFLSVCAVILLLPLRKSESIDRWFTIALIVLVVAIIILLGPRISLNNITSLAWQNWFVPYGVIFFAISGSAVVPEIVEVLHKNERISIRAVVFGTLAAAVLIGIFGAVVVGVCGAATTPAAIAGLEPFFGRPIVVLGSLFGLAAVMTQFVVVGSNVRDELVYDFKKRRLVGWVIAIGIPLAAFALGARDFVGIIGFLGATLGAAVGVIIVHIGRKVMGANAKYAALRRYAIPLMILFVAGFLAEVVSLLK